MKVRRTEFLLLVALASSAVAMQIREDTLSNARLARQQPAVTCNEPAATSAGASPLIQAACHAAQDPREVQGTLHRAAGVTRRVQIQV
jgi:hypothetical protein